MIFCLDFLLDLSQIQLLNNIKNKIGQMFRG